MLTRLIVEGCVAVGKSATMVEMKKLRPSWSYHLEPVESWERGSLQELGGGPCNYLRDYYDSPNENTARRLQVTF
jgi:hypothetical protein